MDSMLYLSFNNKKQTFDIIDGVHRFTALKILKENNSKPLDLITPSEFGNNNDASWLYDSYIILNIRFNSIDSELIEVFKSLNKSNPIPDLYIRDTNQEKRKIIEYITNKWSTKYKPHFSSHNKPNKPNINRDRFMDLLEKLYDKYNICEENKNVLEDILDKTNSNIYFHLPKKITPAVKEKCTNTGCWIFIYTVEQLLHHHFH